MGYRDEHEALRAKIESLEGELADARAQGIDGLRARLDVLRQAADSPARAAGAASLVTEAGRLEESLRALTAEGEALAGRPELRQARIRRRFVVGAAGTLAAALASAIVYEIARSEHNGGRKLCAGWLDPLMLERLANRDCDPLLRVSATDLPGGPHAVAPTELVAVTRRAHHRPGAALRGIEIPRVPRSGLVDFRTMAYGGVVSTHFDHVGGVFDFEGMHLGFEGDGELVSDPHCDVAAVWAAAERAGVRGNGGQMAAVAYKALLPPGRAGWVFESGGRTLLIDDATCEPAADLAVPPGAAR